MIYPYICEDKHETEIELSMKEEIPKRIECSVCKKEAWRNYGLTTTHIPEHMKAGSELYNGDHGANADYLKQRMNHGTRPSGRSKVYY